MVVASVLLLAIASALCAANEPQHPLFQTEQPDGGFSKAGRKLHGRFLHVTDFHPDPYYKVYSSTERACHHGSGDAGVYGAESSSCDTPVSLVNETFQWIDENVRDSIDFIIWTGDSARHDNDEKIPRTRDQVVEQNQLLVNYFKRVFSRDSSDDRRPRDFTIPIIPNFGNNDILPHNIFTKGPNQWTSTYLSIWKKFIPEEQRHAFDRGGWFWVEVIPEKLAVFSLNTLYFFDSNNAVDGCADKSEPGYEQMEWLRVQLQFLRQRGLKAILSGHVPPARTESKMSWDETCWQKYTLWLRQYRDVIVGAVYGHMNIDHFMLQDFEEIDYRVVAGLTESPVARTSIGSEVSIASAADYLVGLRDNWSKLPEPPLSAFDSEIFNPQLEGIDIDNFGRHSKEKYLEKIGGEWGERYSVAHVGPSVVPNYFPTLRIVEYNVTGLESVMSSKDDLTLGNSGSPNRFGWDEDDLESSKKGKKHKKKKGKKRKGKHPKKPKFIVPNPPSKSAPPGPAYSPQTLSWIGYTQYFANLTYINNDIKERALEGQPMDAANGARTSQSGDYSIGSRKKHPKPNPGKFEYEVEYSTFDDKVYKLRDMTVRNYLNLAQRIGGFKPSERIADNEESENESVNGMKGEKHKQHKKGKKRKGNEAWYTFVKRAFVGTKDEEEIHEEY
ncbi:MAG: hypothetical protein M1819_000038 [Sarea resinae]|nr:MAG: hypothetical protein M1819_000038 [Sarea resinae]